MQLSADVALSLSASDLNPALGNRFEYIISLRNDGPNVASSLALQFAPDPKLTFDGSGSGCPPIAPCIVGPIDPGQTLEVRLPYLVRESGTLNATAQVASNGSIDPDASDNSASLTSTGGSRVDLGLQMSAVPSAAQRDTNVDLRITLSNSGPADAVSGGMISITLDPALQIVSGSSGAVTCGSSVGAPGATCVFSSLANGRSETGTLTVRASANGTYRPTARVVARDFDTRASNDEVTVTLTVADQVVTGGGGGGGGGALSVLILFALALCLAQALAAHPERH